MNSTDTTNSNGALIGVSTVQRRLALTQSRKPNKSDYITKTLLLASRIVSHSYGFGEDKRESLALVRVHWRKKLSTPLESVILVASCPSRKSITRAVSGFIFDCGASITESDQFGEEESGRFFMRYEFAGFNVELDDLQSIRDLFRPIADEFQMDWEIQDGGSKPRVLLAVSKFGHYLNDLLFRWRNGDMPFEIVAVESNHPDFQSKVEWYDLPFHHLPVSDYNRQQQ